jgi:hypothetical protein
MTLLGLHRGSRKIERGKRRSLNEDAEQNANKLRSALPFALVLLIGALYGAGRQPFIDDFNVQARSS